MLEVTAPCADVVDAIYGDPGPLTKSDSNRGNILKCAKEGSLSKDDLAAKLAVQNYVGDPPSTSVSVYRVLYQTERGDADSSVGYASAKVLVPDSPVNEKVPAVVVASGTRGQGPSCAASKLSPDANDEALDMFYSIAAAGMPVILTDLAGYANFGAPGNPASAYALAADSGRSMLDAGRALRRLVPKISQRVAFVGHSLGGHTALSALALSETYGAGAEVVAVATHSPFWLPMRLWGALLRDDVAKRFPVATSALFTAIAIWYHYGHAELLDGHGKGIELFLPQYRDAVKHLVENYCSGGSGGTDSLGITYVNEVFAADLKTAVRDPVLAPVGACGADALCTKWIQRYTSERPALTGNAAKVPILVTYGDQDMTISPPRMRCATDKLRADQANLNVCIRTGAGHSDIVARTSSDVAKWIFAQSTGTALPQLTCDADIAGLTAPCSALPPND